MLYNKLSKYKNTTLVMVNVNIREKEYEPDNSWWTRSP